METVEPTIADEAVPEVPTAAPEPAAAPERKNEEVPPAPGPNPRGRPRGAKDRQPRTRRPNIRVEPLPPQATTAPRREPAPTPASAPAPEPQRAPTPEPAHPAHKEPSPRTLYRETSERLVHLRSLMTESRRSAVADKYTSRLYTWTA